MVVFLQRLDVIFGQIFRIDAFFRSVVPCLQGCLVAVKASRIARCIGIRQCMQSNRLARPEPQQQFSFYTFQSFCLQTMLAITCDWIFLCKVQSSFKLSGQKNVSSEDTRCMPGKYRCRTAIVFLPGFFTTKISCPHASLRAKSAVPPDVKALRNSDNLSPLACQGRQDRQSVPSLLISTASDSMIAYRVGWSPRPRSPKTDRIYYRTGKIHAQTGGCVSQVIVRENYSRLFHPFATASFCGHIFADIVKGIAAT